jgi:sensor histidine kinase YesM
MYPASAGSKKAIFVKCFFPRCSYQNQGDSYQAASRNSEFDYLCTMTKNALEIAANIIFWLLTAWLIASSFSIESHEIIMENGVERVSIIRNKGIITIILICVALSVVLFYSNLFHILKLNKRVAVRKVFLGSIALFAGTIMVYRFVEFLISGHLHLLLPGSISWGIITFYFTISIAYGVGKVWQQTERQRQQLSLEKKEAELNLLRSQLHPHFLFNALNNLLAMVDQKQNPELAQSLDRLSGLLRYVVYDTAHAKVLVQKEIDFIQHFAALQALRFEADELDFDLKVIGHHHQQEIEPGIFIPFVENAFKYGVEPERLSKIKIRFDLSEPGRIKFSICNPVFPTMQLQKGKGSGIPAARARLNLVYPGKHQLTIIEYDHYLVELEIETDESNNH